MSRMTDGLITTSWASAAGDLKPWAWVDLQKVYKVPGRDEGGAVAEYGRSWQCPRISKVCWGSFRFSLMNDCVLNFPWKRNDPRCRFVDLS